MTNNLKAERTLTAEELQAIIDLYIVLDDRKNLLPFRGSAFAHLASLYPEYAAFAKLSEPDTVKAMALELQSLRSQSLSTQQPMGEVTWERMARAQSRKLQAVLHVPGVKDVLHELDWENGDPLEGWDFVRLSSLHPNQESGE